MYDSPEGVESSLEEERRSEELKRDRFATIRVGTRFLRRKRSIEVDGDTITTSVVLTCTHLTRILEDL